MSEPVPGVDYEPAACPSCGFADCDFPPACQKDIGAMPKRSYPYHDEED